MRLKTSLNDYVSLYNEVNATLSHALSNLSQSEPQLVANLVYYIPITINRFSFTSLKGMDIKAGGVFVHQQPQVRCENFPEPSPRSVEIGDLLLLRTELQKETIISRRALLLQAKKIDSLNFNKNKNQHHIYANWPRFEYTRSTTLLNGKKRHVYGLDLYNGAKYLLICNSDSCLNCNNDCIKIWVCRIIPNKCVYTAQPTWPEISHHKNFSEELVDFILGGAGKEYKDPHGNDKNWNRVIQDLVGITAKRTTSYMTTTSGGRSTTRGQGFSFISQDVPYSLSLKKHGLQDAPFIFFEDNGPPEVPINEKDNDGEGSGISIIEFEINRDNME